MLSRLEFASGPQSILGDAEGGEQPAIFSSGDCEKSGL